MLHSKESYCAVLSCGTVYHTLQGAEGGSYLILSLWMKSRYVTIQNKTFSAAVYWLGKFFFCILRSKICIFYVLATHWGMTKNTDTVAITRDCLNQSFYFKFPVEEVILSFVLSDEAFLSLFVWILNVSIWGRESGWGISVFRFPFEFNLFTQNESKLSQDESPIYFPKNTKNQ